MEGVLDILNKSEATDGNDANDQGLSSFHGELHVFAAVFIVLRIGRLKWDWRIYRKPGRRIIFK